MARVAGGSRAFRPTWLAVGALRQVAPGEAQLGAWLAARALQGGRVVPLPGLAAVLRAANAGLRVERIGPAPGPPPDDVVALALSGTETSGQVRMALGLERGAARRLVDAALGRASAGGTGPLSSGEQGVLLYVIDRAGGDWLAAGGAAFSVRGLLPDPSQIGDYLGPKPRWQVTGRLVTERHSERVWLWGDPPRSPDRAAPPRSIPQSARAWPIRWRLVVGTARLPVGEVGDLTRRDVVVLDTGGHPEHSARHEPGWIRSGHVAWRGRWLDRHRFELLSLDPRRTTMGHRQAEPIEARLDDTPREGAAGMEVVLQAEVGRLSLPLEQALALVPGRVLGLDREVGTTVCLMAGEQLVARGELVESEGQLAVEITEVP